MALLKTEESGINCPDRNVLLAFRTGDLPETAAEGVISHVAACPGCQTTLHAFGDAEDTLVAKLRSPAVEDPYKDEPQRAELMARAMAIVAGGPPGADRPPAASPATADLGRLGEYELLARLGEGGMGVVYKARHTRLDKIVALKVLPKHRTADSQARTRFEREMKAIGRVSHVNIVQAYDARDIEGTTVLVMEYADGLDLGEVLRRRGPLPVAAACEIVRQTALGLQVVHESGLIHRDIKPSNIMLTRQGEVKILDLGLALLSSERAAPAELTSSGQIMGTADYMAPEQAFDSHHVDIRADVYSLGCTLYKLLTGDAPYDGPEYDSLMKKLQAHLQVPAPSLAARSGVPSSLGTVIQRMLAKTPAERFATPQEVAAAIAPFAAGCNLARLAAEAATNVPLSLGDRAGVRAAAGDLLANVPPAALRRFSRSAVAASLACLGLGLVIAWAVVLLIRDRSGRETKIEIPDGAEARVSPDGQVEVKVSGANPPVAPSGRHAVAGEVDGGPTVPPVLISISGDGYWIAGRTETIQARWNIDAKRPTDPAEMAWRMVCGQAILASGRQKLASGRAAAAITVQVPSVRAATEVDYLYRLEQVPDHKVLQEGKCPLHLSPDDLLAGVAARLSGKQILVWDRPEGLPAVLAKAKIEHARIAGEAGLQFTSPNIVLVGADQLGKETMDQSRLLNLAATGAGVMIFRQTEPAALAGYALTRRAAPAKLAWQEDHPLARDRRLLDPSGKPDDLWAIRFPADEPVLEIACWPAEAAGGKPAPIDALVAVKALGRGRLVLCQIPLGPWSSDPRSQRFLADALDYLLSPVQATAPLSRRQRPVETARPEIPTIRFPSGDSHEIH